MSTISLADVKLGAQTVTAASAAFRNYITTQVFPEEGPYSNDPNDSGGETSWGITAEVARRNGYTGAMKDMTQAQALLIYMANDWHAPGLDQLALVNLALALTLLDLGINMGDQTAVMFLQRLLKVLGVYAGKLDGFIGPVSCKAVSAFLSARGDDGLRVLFAGVHGAAGMRYVEIVEAIPKDAEYVFGWMKNRAYPAITA